jgi:6-phosphogluconolactonase
MRSLVSLVAICGCGSSPDAGVDAAPGADATPDASAPSRLVAYVSGYAPDIRRYDLGDDGSLTAIGSTTAFTASPSFLAITQTALYAVSEATSRVAAYRIAPATGTLTLVNDASTGGSGPAHVSLDRSGAYVLVANFGDGSVASLAIRPDLGVAAPQAVAVGANAHMIITDPSNRYAFVPCRNADYVAQLVFDATTGALTPNAVPHLDTAAGAGPRHLAFAPDGHHVYLINELDSTISALTFDPSTGRLSAHQTISTRAAGATGDNTGAEVWVHPSGTFVYASNRGDNTIAVFAVADDGRLTPVGQVATLGKTPRDFTLDPAGRWLYVANQDSGSVVPFAIDPQFGMLSPIAAPVTATSPSFVGIVALPR